MRVLDGGEVDGGGVERCVVDGGVVGIFGWGERGVSRGEGRGVDDEGAGERGEKNSQGEEAGGTHNGIIDLV